VGDAESFTRILNRPRVMVAFVVIVFLVTVVQVLSDPLLTALQGVIV
jgi:hypothetical protein